MLSPVDSCYFFRNNLKGEMMKRVILGVSAMALLSFTSCKKDYDCECTYQNTGNTTVTEHHTVKNSTLDDAKKTCDGYEDDDPAYTKTCSLL